MRIVAGEFKNRKLKVPEGLDVRPTTNQMREAVFNICQFVIEGSRFLDIFAGSGGMGLEALSRGADYAAFIDCGKSSVRCIADNIKTLGVEDQTTVWSGDALKVVQQLDRSSETFDLIYIDPPYDIKDSEVYFKLLTLLDEGQLLKAGGRVFVEAGYKAKINLPIEGYKNLKFNNKRRYGVAELYQFMT